MCKHETDGLIYDEDFPQLCCKICGEFYRADEEETWTVVGTQLSLFNK